MNHERRGTMGIVVSDITQAYLNELGVPNGVYVTDVASGSPAMQAGISVGDVLISVAGEDIDEVSEFTSVITSYNKEQEIKVTLNRTYINKNHNRIVTVTLDEVR